MKQTTNQTLRIQNDLQKIMNKDTKGGLPPMENSRQKRRTKIPTVKRDQIANRLSNDMAIPKVRNGKTREKKPKLGASLFSTSRSLGRWPIFNKYRHPLSRKIFCPQLKSLVPVVKKGT